MQTTWGDLVISDAHIHFFSHAYLSGLARQKGIPVEEAVATLGWELPPADPARAASRWVSELDTRGVDSAVLIASVHGDDDSVAAAMRAYPGRFHGFFMLDPTARDAITRLRGAFEKGLRGVCLFPAMHRYRLSDERALAVVEAASAQPGSVIFAHCGVLSVGARKKLGLPSPFDLRFSNPLDLHAVALQYENVPFIIPHFGAGLFREALMVADVCPNIYLDTSSSNRWLRYQVPDLSLKEVFRRALDVVGPKRLLFGTDSSYFPRGWVHEIFEAQSGLLFDLGLGLDAAASILGKNLRRILQVEPND